ncbi:F0F1 ATP synthase subunit delta [Fervidobacterium thailandense]|uniref:ATP synthase subunit delta n=1 Tax=Fervidobacterium thailandense TaxID=1008305 RepID=A0A1E3G0G4_9BACT|nr:F0F1 ATP synthase subunit delta [Fervidobacterium thailandense]ODN29766.1 F0F1 ATP synthase subunit delta [Fervidobacterium thailandense]
MIYSSVASKYALALLNVSKRLGKTEHYGELLKVTSQIYDSLATVLNNQALKPEIRANLIVEILRSLNLEVDEPFKRFVHLLIVNKRIKYVKQIASYYDYSILEDNGLVPVEVTSALPLSDEEREVLTNFVMKYTNRKPVFQEKLNEELVAGVVLEFAGKKLDASIKGRLERIAREITR